MSSEPLIHGAALKKGAHIDLIGADTPAMREADDTALAREDIEGDMHDLVQGRAGRASDEEITVFKNGGGAHLDVMIAHAVYRALEGR